MRRENPSASAELILDTLVLEGPIEQRAISPSAVRRLFASRGLDRQTLRNGSDGKQRLRWEAERPGALWHGDVCHGAHILIHGEKKPVRVHGLLDDCSRFVVELEAMHQERESRHARIVFASEEIVEPRAVPAVWVAEVMAELERIACS